MGELLFMVGKRPDCIDGGTGGPESPPECRLLWRYPRYRAVILNREAEAESRNRNNRGEVNRLAIGWLSFPRCACPMIVWPSLIVMLSDGVLRQESIRLLPSLSQPAA